MVRKKDSVALFEVISKSRGKHQESGMSVPRWITGSEEPEEPASPEERLRVEPDRPAPTMREPSGPAEPMFATSGRRLKVSLNYLSCTIVVLGLVLALAGAFALGRATAPASPVEKPGKTTAGTRQVKGPVRGTRPPVTRNPRRVLGKYYLVIESLKGKGLKDRAEAERIAEFCKQNGEPADVQSMGTKYIVWSLTGFDSPRSEAAIRHARFIQDNLGKEYFKPSENRIYKFLQMKDGKFDPYYLPYRGP